MLGELGFWQRDRVVVGQLVLDGCNVLEAVLGLTGSEWFFYVLENLADMEVTEGWAYALGETGWDLAAQFLL